LEEHLLVDGPDRAASRSGLAPIAEAGTATGVARVARLVYSGMDRCCGALLVLTLVVTSAIEFATVVKRALGGSGFTWADSACEIGLAVMAFLGAVTSFIRDDHVGMAGLKERYGPRVRRELVGAIGCFSLIAAVVMTKESLSLASDSTLGKFPATGWSTQILYVPLAAGGVLLALTIAVGFVRAGLRGIPWIGIGATAVLVLAYAGAMSANPLGLQNGTAIALTVVVILGAILIGTPIAFAMLIAVIAGILIQRFPLTQVALQMTNGVEHITLLALPMFILVGVLYTQVGFSDLIAQAFRKLGRRVPAADGVAMVAAMFVFSGLSGSKLADVSAIGTAFTGGQVDEDRSAERGMDEVTRAETSGLVSASAVMGEVIAPSIAMLVLGSVTTVSTGALFAAGLLPAVVVGVAIVAVAVLRHEKFPSARASGVDESWWVLLAKSVPAMIGIIVLAGVVVTGTATATEASAVAAVYSVVLAFLYRTPPRRMVRAIGIAARLSGMLLFTIAAAGVLSWFLTVSGLSTYVTDLSSDVGGHASLFMIAMIVILVLVGSAVEGLPAIILLAPLLIPQAEQLGIDPVQAGIVILLSMGVGIFLPPLGNGYYTSCTACGVKPGRAVAATMVYMLPVIVGILVVAFVPEISTRLPDAFGLS
jgi:tripartite ATP-independent transporter DctM subunit